MKALGTAAAAALLVLGAAACASDAGNGASIGSGDPCVDLPQAERDFCLRQRSFRGDERRVPDPKPSPSGY